MGPQQSAGDGANQERSHQSRIHVAQAEMQESRDSREYDGVQDIGSDAYLGRETVEQQQQHHNDAARSHRGHAHQNPGHQPDQRHAQKTLRGRCAIGNSFFNSFLQQQQRGNHDEQHTHRGLDKDVDPIAVQVADVHQQFHASEGAGNAPSRKRKYDRATHRTILEVHQAGRNLRENVKQRVGTDRHDRRDFQPEDQNREQQNAAPHAVNTDQHANDKANQNDGCEHRHKRCDLLFHPVYSDEAFALQVQNNFLCRFFGGQFASIDGYVGIRWRFVGIRDSREFLKNARPRLGIESLAVALFAHFHRGGDVYKDEAAIGLDQLAYVLTRRIIRSNGRANRDAAVLRDFRGHISNAANVDVAMLFRESQFRGKVLAHQVPVEQGHRAPADFQKLRHQDIRNRGFARTRQSGEEDGDPLLGAWRKASPQFLNNFWIGEPRRNIAAFIQPIAQFRARDIQNLVTLLDFIVRNVAVFILQVDHHAEGHHGHADVGLVLLENLLRLVGTVEGLAVGVFARAGVIAAHNEMSAAVVLANQRMPDRFPRSAHSHGQGQQRKLLGSLRILRTQQLVAAHSRVVIHVSGLGHADHGMNQQVGFDLLGRAKCELYVGAVHGFTRLKSHPAK